ncbi:hypothetical protein [Actinoplanes sp. RD1]|uniref:hypothetical protein n=1 Tax=Actinoplanes sp. RD1 TaxID=3064538 RepID=UPI0027415C78|nr:hypothetical protein [Actinoplanes sp. RD1]
MDSEIALAEQWQDIADAVLAVFEEEMEKVRKVDATLIWRREGKMWARDKVSCILTVWHRGADDPHLELDAMVRVGPGQVAISCDIGTTEGEIFAELRPEDGAGPTLDAAIARLRAFFAVHAELMRREGTATP